MSSHLAASFQSPSVGPLDQTCLQFSLQTPTMQLVVPVLLCVSTLFYSVDGSVGIIDCEGRQGEKLTVESYQCGEDGSAVCRNRIEDCTECGPTGQVMEGKREYDSRGKMVAGVGGGWDCRQVCQENKGQTGSNQRIERVTDSAV